MLQFGCYAQTHKEEIEKIDEIDLILGNNEKNNIVSIIEKYCSKKNKEIDLNKCFLSDIDNQKEFLDFGTVTYTDKTRAVIKVQDGCNNFCSYCLIPYARGRIRSRQKESVIEEITNICKKGIQEVVITGIHVASYGKDFEKNYELIDLLEDINKIEELKRIRLGSLEPNIITEDFVKRLSKLEKMCNHFHLSLQSGCSQTLKRMNRKYSAEDFEKSVKRLREYFPNVALTADLIVGFPGETEEEFNYTYKFLQKIKFTKIHVFKYSPRKGTRAASMENQIDGNIKEIRSKKIIELSNKNEEEFLDKQINKTLEVLFEKQEGKYWVGHTSNYIEVKKISDNLENKLINITIQCREGLELIAK